MPPNSSGVPPLLLKPSMRRVGPPVAGSSTPLAAQRSEFEDFMNAYRPTLDLPLREPPPPKHSEESKVDFGRSIKKLMKRPQGSPSTQSKNQRKEGIQRTPTVVVGYQDIERSIFKDSKTQTEKQKAKRPVSANLDASLSPPQQPFGQGPTVLVPLDANLSKSNAIPPAQPPPVPPPAKSPKTSVHQAPAPPPPKGSKPATLQPGPNPSAKSPKASVQQPPASPQSKTPPKPKTPKPEPEDVSKMPPDSASVLSASAPSPNPNQMKKKVSIQEEKRRSGTEGFSDAHCLIITGNNIGRFLPPRHNPDPILNMRVVPVQERKYHIILEFEESPLPPRPLTSPSGLMVIGPEETGRDTRDQANFFSWIKEAHVVPMGMLLMNVERITEFPFLTYLVVGGGRNDLAQKLKFVGERPVMGRHDQLRFIAGYEEPVTICMPPLSTFPEKPSSDKTGFVICLYQVLEGDDSLRFEQNWVMWTGARQLYRTLPAYMGLKRMSVHKSIIPTKTINYVLVCEFSNIMDYVTDACVLIDHLRARCCGFIGIYRVLDAL